MKLDDLNINVFLDAAMPLRTLDEVMEFAVSQRVQRGIVTSFGSLYEQIIVGFFKNSVKIHDIDFSFKRDDIQYHVQVKSGPEGFTGPALTKTIETMEELKRKDPDCKNIIAFSYGKEEKISKVWRTKLTQAENRGILKVLIGRKFWNFVTQEDDGWLILLNIFKKAGVISDTDVFGEVVTLEKARKNAQERILKEARKRYGKNPDDLLLHLAEDNL